jgi:tRNA pseudouridine55 synthase
MKDGVVIVNKGEGISSQGVVSRVKRIFGVAKAGHTGTLDPLATGVLPVLVGRAVKASEFMLTADKHYKATLLLGMTTDTEDITGEVLTRCDDIPSEAEVLSAVNSFVGDIMQIPPMYSALKVGGRKLCDLARAGEVIDREPRAITVYSITTEKLTEREYSLDIKCSKGTYIRTLCADIGARLGCGGTMKTLCRMSAAGFGISETHTLEELDSMTEDEKHSAIIPTEEIFKDKPLVMLPDFFARLARCGAVIYLKKLGLELEVSQIVRLRDKDGFFAVGEVRDTEEGRVIKPIRQFDV